MSFSLQPFSVSPQIAKTPQFSGASPASRATNVTSLSSTDIGSTPVHYNSTILTAVGGCLGSCAAVVGLLVGGLVLLLGKVFKRLKRAG